MIINKFHDVAVAYPNVVNIKIVVIFCSLDPLADVTSSQIRIFVWTASSITNLSITKIFIIDSLLFTVIHILTQAGYDQGRP